MPRTVKYRLSSDAIHARREQLSMSMKAIAEAAGVHISSVMRASVEPVGLRVATRIASALRCKLDDLLAPEPPDESPLEKLNSRVRTEGHGCR